MIYLNKKNDIPLYEQLYSKIKEQIVSGTLPKNTALSSLRVMEKELQVSRNTVDRAYQQLLAEGYIRSVPGAGYFVEDIENDYFCYDNLKVSSYTKENTDKKKKMKYDFEYASIDSDLFPWGKWKKYIHNAMLSESSRNAISYESNKGNELLRKSLCGFLNRHRGVNCEPEQIIICAGTQYGMEIVSNLLPADVNRLAFEEPGYNAMRYMFEEKGYAITSIPVLEDGVDLELLSKTNCNILYITPSHQFPTGVVTSISNRNKMLKWACNNDAYIVENDYDSEFRYGSMPIPSLQSLDKCGKVIYVGTMSKVLSPSIRCAYVILPQELIKVYDKKYKYFNSALPSYHQFALAQFIEDGMLEKHLRRVSTINEKKYFVLIKAIKEFLSDEIEIFTQPSGVHTLVRFKNCKNQKELIEKMEEASIAIYGIKMYWHDQKSAQEDTFLMGFNSMSEDDIRNGCMKMAKVLRELK
ncbi:UNVERIFIED_CONTAM: GntR family transcriptional regulator/MocR family aminotransferase [Acetivibrio alkalicellulosi]